MLAMERSAASSRPLRIALFVYPGVQALDLSGPLELFARTTRILQVRGGLTGQRLLGAGEIAAIATLPSREVLLGRVVGQIQAPLYGLVGVLSGAIRQFAYVLQARIDQLGGAPAEAPAGE